MDAQTDWRKRLQRGLSDENVADILVQALSEAVALRSAQRTEPGRVEIILQDGTSITSRLENLERELAAAPPDDREQVLARYVQAVRQSAETDASTVDSERDRILPVIRNVAYMAQCRTALAYADEGQRVAARPLAADLWVAYVADEADFLRLVTERNRTQLELSLDELDRLALENLHRHMPEPRCVGNGEFFMVHAGGFYEASLLLVPSFWEDVKNRVRGSLVACAPAWDVLLFTGTGEPAGLKHVRNLAREILARGSHAISPALLRWTGPGWAEYKPLRRFLWWTW